MPIAPATARRAALDAVAASGTIVRRGRRLRAAPVAWRENLADQDRADAEGRRAPAGASPRPEAERWRRPAASQAPPWPHWLRSSRPGAWIRLAGLGGGLRNGGKAAVRQGPASSFGPVSGPLSRTRWYRPACPGDVQDQGWCRGM